jgi:hypothetical protein
VLATHSDRKEREEAAASGRGTEDEFFIDLGKSSSVHRCHTQRSALLSRTQADDGSEAAYASWMDWTQDGQDVFGLAFLARRGLDADGPSGLPAPAPSSSGAVASSGVTKC